MRALEYVGNCVIVKAFSMTKDQMLKETIHANWLQHNWFKLMLKLQQVNRIKQKLVDFNDEKKIRIASIVKSNSCDASSLFIHNHFFFVRSIHRKFTVWIARLNSAYNFFFVFSTHLNLFYDLFAAQEQLLAYNSMVLFVSVTVLIETLLNCFFRSFEFIDTVERQETWILCFRNKCKNCIVHKFFASTFFAFTSLKTNSLGYFDVKVFKFLSFFSSQVMALHISLRYFQINAYKFSVE